MVDTRIQKAYNFAYGSLKTSCRLLPYAMKAPARSAGNVDVIGNDPWSIRFREYLEITADQFQRIYRLEGGKALDVAVTRIREAATIWKANADLKAGNPEYTAMIRKVLEKLTEAKAELDERSPIQYRFWMLNPWRYFPKKLD